ncbi:AAA family ATPase [Piscinibacter sp.]|uniref:ATP-binding protein n=1 Tax=Piscinibacter sp. TaxID=1903157 RepID=UPI0035ADBF7E
MSVPPSARTRLLLAGRPAVVFGGASEAVPLAERDGALLAWLALEGATARSRLALLLWPDSGLAAARNSLRQRLFKLRRQFGTDLVDGDDTLTLAPGVVHDLAPGEGVLGAQPVRIGGEFGQWLEAQRERRRGRARSALEAQADAAERSRDWAAALSHAHELLALEPLSEAAHRRAMRLHYLAGDRAAALLAFDRCERVLKDDVGARPDAETTALLAMIERDAAPGPARGITSAAAIAITRPPRFVARGRELAALQAAVHAGRHVLVIGEGGLGKSRLLAEFLAVLDGGTAGTARLAPVGARPGDADVPYALFARLMRALLAAGHRPDTALAPELARFVPELGESAATRFEPGRFDAAAERYLLALPASGGAAIAIDDLHFADAASVELITRLLAVPAMPPLVLGLRPADGVGALVALQEAATELPGCERVVLAPFTEPQLAELVDSLGIAGLEGATLAAPLLRHTGGNPQFVLETLRTLLAERGIAGLGSALTGGMLPVPAGVGAMIERRLKRLSPAALKLARLAAIAGGDFDAPLAVQVLGGDLLDWADPWAELEAAQVLGPHGFAHDLVGETVRASVPRAVARPLHAGLARALEAGGGAAGAIARHWLAAGEIERAIGPCERAARQAREASRLHEAAALYAMLAQAHEARGDAAARFAALNERADVLFEIDGAAEFDAALDQLDALAASDAQRARVFEQRTKLAVARWEREAAEQFGRRALELAQRCGDRALELDARCALAQALFRMRRPDEAAIVLAAIRDWVDQHASAEQRLVHDECLAWLALEQGRYLESGRQWQQVADQAIARGSMSRLQTALNYQMLALGSAGRYLQAAEVGERERALIHEFRLHGNGLVNNDLNLAHLHTLAGRYQDALAALARAEAVPVAPRVTLDLRRGNVYALLGQPARAKPLFERALEAAADDTQRLLPALGLARLLHAMPRQAGARPDARDERMHELLALAARTLRPASTVQVRSRQHLVEAELASGPARLAAAQAALDLLVGSESLGLLLTARARRTQALFEIGDMARAAAAADDQLAFGDDALPELMSPAEPGLIALRVLAAVDDERAARLLRHAAGWLHHTAAVQVPAEFRDSFLHRVPAHRELLALAAGPLLAQRP